MVVIPRFRLSNELAMKLDEMARFEGVDVAPKFYPA